ncbi:hypothetical protein LXL04_001685 [Taraxacum kok-saghyz]
MHPNPNSILDESQFPEYKSFEEYEQVYDQFPEMESAAVDEELPPLEDVNSTIDSYCNQFDAHPLSQDQTTVSIPELDQLTKGVTDSALKSNLAYPEHNSPASLELLSCIRSKFKHLPKASIDETVPESAGKLSTVEIIELAAEKFIKFSTQRVSGYTMFTHPYGSSAFTSLSIDETREVELVFQLLTAADKVCRKQFDIACKFITRCGWVASDSGSPVERLVFYFCEALKKRIGEETGVPFATKREKLVS